LYPPYCIIACVERRSYLTKVHGGEHAVVICIEEVKDLLVHFDVAFGALRNDEFLGIEVLVSSRWTEGQRCTTPAVLFGCGTTRLRIRVEATASAGVSERLSEAHLENKIS